MDSIFQMDKKLCIKLPQIYRLLTAAKSILKNIPIPIFKTKSHVEHILQIVAVFESECHIRTKTQIQQFAGESKTYRYGIF